jgi:hypothetical protein
MGARFGKKKASDDGVDSGEKPNYKSFEAETQVWK